MLQQKPKPSDPSIQGQMAGDRGIKRKTTVTENTNNFLRAEMRCCLQRARWIYSEKQKSHSEVLQELTKVLKDVSMDSKDEDKPFKSCNLTFIKFTDFYPSVAGQSGFK